jgi:hypothetical protein
MALVESTTFDAATGVASDLDTLLKAAGGAPVADITRAAESPEVQLFFAQRIMELAERDFDVRYLNPADTAITVYLGVLGRVRPPLAEAVATTALGLRNGWWAPRMARRILAASHLETALASSVSITLSKTSTTVNLTTADRDEAAICAHGLSRYLRNATVIAEGSVGSLLESGSIMFTRFNLGGTAPALASAGTSDTVDDNLALAA